MRTFDVDDCDDRPTCVAAKAGRTVSVCIPCRDEAATIGAARAHDPRRRSSTRDRPRRRADRARRPQHRRHGRASPPQAGATVVPIDDVHAAHGVGHGKGNALWATLLASHGDFVVWCDGDVTSFEPDWVARLLAPLLDDDDGRRSSRRCYHRPTHARRRRPHDRARRPAAAVAVLPRARPASHQPLSGEFAGRRDVLEPIPFVEGWGVEIAMLVDIAARFGAERDRPGRPRRAAPPPPLAARLRCRPPR